MAIKKLLGEGPARRTRRFYVTWGWQQRHKPIPNAQPTDDHGDGTSAFEIHEKKEEDAMILSILVAFLAERISDILQLAKNDITSEGSHLGKVVPMIGPSTIANRVTWLKPFSTLRRALAATF